MSDWHARWQQGRIGFHRADVHPALRAYERRFVGDRPHRVFVPLCGKTVDIPWLVSRGHEVVAVELVDQAVRELHAEHGIDATVTREPPFSVYRSPGLTVYQGDFFALRTEHVGVVDRVWDRASLIALPVDLRRRYAAHLSRLVTAPWAMLLCTIEYDPAVMDGPPFSVAEAEVRDHYRGCRVEILDRRDAIADEPRWRARGHRYWIETTYWIATDGE